MSAPAVLVLTLTPEDLGALITAAVAAAYAGTATAKATAALVDRREAARVLGVSPATVGRLMSEGAPHVFVGQSPRFDVAAFRAWLEARGRQGTKAAPAKTEKIGGVRLLSRRAS